MSCTTCAVFGTGFCLYDTYNDETGEVSHNVDDFIKKFFKHARTLPQYKNIDWNYPDITIEDILCEIPLAEYFDYTDDEISSHFVNLDNEETDPCKMICVWSEKTPSLYQQPYKTRHQFVLSMKEQLKEIGFLECLPENFDIEAHLGTFDTCICG